MSNSDLLILRGNDVRSLLTGREAEIIESVRSAYLTHGSGASSLPHSTFLRFPDNARNRIIALPAYLGGEFSAAGVKWIASFPGNLEQEMERASAVIILNDAGNGRPQTILEGSLISAKRTAASAALAAHTIHGDGPHRRVGLVGTGLINFEIACFLRALYPHIATFAVYDINEVRARQFADKCQTQLAPVEVEIIKDLPTLLESTQLISFATTALAPHVASLAPCAPGTTILHISLRDLTPEVVLANDNVVDDVDHVCRAQTSVHLAEQLVGRRDFIRCTLADIFAGAAPARASEGGITVFSPFGLGVLDLAVSKLVCKLACEQNLGLVINKFLPEQ
jgi:2,3-diaminopropionate biosynthesis protein SbnB